MSLKAWGPSEIPLSVCSTSASLALNIGVAEITKLKDALGPEHANPPARGRLVNTAAKPDAGLGIRDGIL